ncbi:MAG: sigma-70 family RNA polymerase sigma factor [Clostridia bacterium]|nr:sigma-70 family RNA polymerase sigma factor [Clostridia bacterium]
MKIDKVKLHELMKKQISGEQVEKELYQNYSNLVYKIAFSILKNKESAEDVMQNVFTKIVEMPKEKLPKEKEATWLYTVTKNEAISYIRKNQKEVCLEEIYEFIDEDTNIEDVIEKEDYQNLIRGLDKEEQEIISLKVLSKLKFRQIAILLNMPIGTVQWKYYRAVKALKISLGNLTTSLLFAIAYILSQNTRKKSNVQETTGIKNEQANQDSIQENVQESDNKKENEISKDKDAFDNERKNIVESEKIENTVQIPEEIPEIIQTNNYYLLGISGVFLIISIIFLIIFQKHQQKRKLNSSK